MPAKKKPKPARKPARQPTMLDRHREAGQQRGKRTRSLQPIPPVVVDWKKG